MRVSSFKRAVPYPLCTVHCTCKSPHHPRTSLEALTHAKFSSASDVWSYGVTLWEIYSLGAIPWKGLTPIEIRDCLVGGERLGCPERCPREIYHVMTSSWETRAQDRPTFASIYQTLQKVSCSVMFTGFIYMYMYKVCTCSARQVIHVLADER